MTRWVLPAFLLVVLWTADGQGQVVVNEVLANEPGSYRSLEWIELYSYSAVVTDLTDFTVRIDDDTVRFSAGQTIPAGGYLVICRRLTASDGGASFESHWGDSSGVWGDCQSEIALGTVMEASFGLTNSEGAAVLFNRDMELSRLSWSESGEDGVSWERVAFDGDEIGPCVDAEGATPGRINSLTPVQRDLAIIDVSCRIENRLSHIGLTVANVGRRTSDPVDLYLTCAAGSEVFEIAPMPPAMDTTVTIATALEDWWTLFEARLPEDDRAANDQRSFFVPGGDYPPLVIVEFLVNPGDGLESEWVEILNRSDSVWSLAEWAIGDSRITSALVGGFELEPDERLVVVQDSDAVRRYYSSLEGELLQPETWPRLNDGGDTVRLQDPHGLIADARSYNTVFDQNYTWCRNEGDLQGDQWGRSAQVGGSPGRANVVVLAGDQGETSLEISPRVFSPDGDGIEDSCTITIKAPDLTEFQLRVFDRTGVEVRRLDDGHYLSRSYAWCGRDASGHRVPIGIYVVCLEISGGGTHKETVVVAR